MVRLNGTIPLRPCCERYDRWLDLLAHSPPQQRGLVLFSRIVLADSSCLWYNNTTLIPCFVYLVRQCTPSRLYISDSAFGRRCHV